MSGLLTFDRVTGARGGRTLFRELSLTLAAGDAAVVTGPNGAGKSSLIRLAAGLLAPAAGSVTATRAALLTEAHALDAERPLAAALRFWAAFDPQPDAAARVADALRDVGLADLAQVPVRLLSTGQRRRAALARVVAGAAPLWLLDEPANGLDEAAVRRLETLIARHRGGGGAVLVATHLTLEMPHAQKVVLG